MTLLRQRMKIEYLYIYVMETVDKYIIKAFGIDHNTAATITITLSIFVLTQLLTGFVRVIKNRKEKKSYRKNLLFIIEIFGKSCAKQYKTVIKCLPDIGSDNENVIINTITLNSISFLNDMDLYAFTKNFNRVLNTKNYSKAVSILFSIINQIKTINDAESEMFNRVAGEITKYQDMYNQAIRKMREIGDELGMKFSGLKIQNRQMEYMNNYVNIFNQWKDNGGKTYYKDTYNEIVQRVVELNKEYKDVEMILMVNQYVAECYLGYINLVHREVFLVKSLTDFAYKHRRASILIDKAILPNLKYNCLQYNCRLSF